MTEALSMADVIDKIALRVREITQFAAVYSAADNDEFRLPEAITAFPCAMVYPGPDLEPYILSSGRHRHVYEVNVEVFQGGGDIGARAASVLPFVDRIIEKFVANVTLGGGGATTQSVEACMYSRQSGFVSLEYGGVSYTGYQVVLKVTEEATATPATGS